ncbi:MAG: zinc ribbon domain-containing protein [Deltaproteobacteria bacterium]|nr:zinc ribbon domain-containing protein [Deltaproteobacteria bacterium]
MPVYEYECTKCGYRTELLQRITDPPLSKCEKCSGKMKKLISNSTFHLKGSGWYVTDYASKSGGYDGKTKNNGESNSTKEASSASNEPKSAGEKSQKDSFSSSEIKAKAKD